jgi:peptidase E
LRRESSNSLLKPIYLFADSQPLFWKRDGVLFIKSLVGAIETEQVRAVYVGASNGDNPDYYSLFHAAMQGAGVFDCHMIRSSLPEADAARVAEADLILLAGGDAGKGWDAFRQTGLDQLLVRRYHEGATLIGLSAGAMQLGLFGWRGDEPTKASMFEALKLVPFVIGAHEEAQQWAQLRAAISSLDADARGLGIPSGAVLIYHPNGRLEPLRHAVILFSKRDGKLTRSLLPAEAETRA